MGRPPFETNDTKTTYRKILKANYAFPSNVVVSETAKDLIKRILVLEPQKRPTLDEILEHPFIRNNYTKSLSLPSRDLNISSKKLSTWQSSLSPANMACRIVFFLNHWLIFILVLQTPQANERLGSQEKDIDGSLWNIIVLID